MGNLFACRMAHAMAHVEFYTSAARNTCGAAGTEEVKQSYVKLVNCLQAPEWSFMGMEHID